MFSSKKIKIEKELLTKLEAKAESSGYSSVDELIIHLLEKAVAEDQEKLDREQVDRQLRGLGYLE